LEAFPSTDPVGDHGVGQGRRGISRERGRQTGHVVALHVDVAGADGFPFPEAGCEIEPRIRFERNERRSGHESETVTHLLVALNERVIRIIEQNGGKTVELSPTGMQTTPWASARSSPAGVLLKISMMAGKRLSAGLVNR
jgi:hypothetical protein